jgi:replicative DNA helicase
MISVERAVIGSVLIDQSCATVVCSELSAEFFTDYRLADIFAAIKRLYDVRSPIDMVTVAAALSAEGKDYAVLLAELSAEVITSANIRGYVDELQRSNARRGFAAGLEEAMRLLKAGDDACYSVAKQAAEAAQSSGHSTAMIAADILPSAVAKLGDRETGIMTGYGMLDYMTNGFKSGNLVVIGARTSVGKTAFACNIASNMAADGNVVLMFSLEMSKDEVLGRMLLTKARKTRDSVLFGTADEIFQAQDEMAKWKLFIDDRASPTVGQIHSAAYKVKQREGRLDCVFVDYIGLLKTVQRSGKSRQEEVSEVSRSMKLLAKEIGCPVVILCQLNRGLELNGGRAPMLSDLRESGAIEQDADIVLLLHRPWMHDKTEQEDAAELNVAKNRSGAVGVIDMKYEAAYTQFRERI